MKNGKRVYGSRGGNAGVLRVVERAISKPVAGQVRIHVEACGVCRSDLATVQGDYPGLKLPRVPGHEVVGRIEEIGPNVSKWKIGQRVGVSFLGGQDSKCEPCLRGDFLTGSLKWLRTRSSVFEPTASISNTKYSSSSFGVLEHGEGHKVLDIISG
jgi:hypothetical protein